ncbi:unnamed protein product, partial [Meganyctiphanes norvegica]
MVVSMNGVLTDLVRPDLANHKEASNLAFNEHVKALKKSGRDISHFAFGQSPFPIPQCIVDGLKEFAHENAYLPMTGIPELRAALVEFHIRYDDIKLDLEGFVVGPGSKELLYLVMTTFNGDILLPAPAWTTYAPQIKLAGKEAVIIPTSPESGWRLSADILTKALQRPGLKQNKILILTNPGNPTGTCFTEKELKEISAVCRQHGVIVMTDEIYGRLAFSGKHTCMVKYYPEGTILTSGFSKWASAGGWRLGYAHFPSTLSSLLKAVRSAASHTYSCAPAPMQFAMAKALRENSSELDRYMKDCTRVLKAVASYCYKELKSVGVGGVQSEAGYYYMPDFEVVRKGLLKRNITTGDGMSQAMLEADVALMGSHAFLQPAEELTTRFCFVCFDGRAALKALQDVPVSVDLDDKFVEQYAQPVVLGVQKIKSWVINLTQ